MEAGVLEEIVGRLLNHTPLSITGQRYARPSLDALAASNTKQTCAELTRRTRGSLEDSTAQEQRPVSRCVRRKSVSRQRQYDDREGAGSSRSRCCGGAVRLHDKRTFILLSALRTDSAKLQRVYNRPSGREHELPYGGQMCTVLRAGLRKSLVSAVGALTKLPSPNGSFIGSPG